MSTVVVISDSAKVNFFLAYLPAGSPKVFEWAYRKYVLVKTGRKLEAETNMLVPTKLARCFSLQKSWFWWVFWWENVRHENWGKWMQSNPIQLVYIYIHYICQMCGDKNPPARLVLVKIHWIELFFRLLRRSISWNNKELEDRTEFVRSVSQQAET